MSLPGTHSNGSAFVHPVKSRRTSSSETTPWFRKQHFDLHQLSLAAMTSLHPRSSACGIRPRTEKALPKRPQVKESSE